MVLFFTLFTNSYSQNKKVSDVELYNICIAKADSLITNKNYEQAIKILDKGLDIKLNEKIILFKRGIAYFGIQDNKKAIDDFTKVINIDEKSAGAYYFRSLAKFNLNKHSEPDFENIDSACDDLYKAKQAGYPLDFVDYKEICPNL